MGKPDFRELPPGTRLYVNPNPDKPYYVEKDLKTGEQEIYDLITRSKKEEAWLYLEYVEGGRLKKIWYETGSGEKVRPDPLTKASVETNFETIRALLSGKKIIYAADYHFHPEKPLGATGARITEFASLPSDRDIARNVFMNSVLKTSKEYPLPSVVITRAGRFSWAPLPEANDFLISAEAFIKINHTMDKIEALANRKYSGRYTEKLPDDPQLQEILNAFSADMRKIGIDMKFEPLKLKQPEGMPIPIR